MAAIHGLLLQQFGILSVPAKDGIRANEMIRRKFEDTGRHYKLIIIYLNEVSSTLHNDDALIEQVLTKMIHTFYDE